MMSHHADITIPDKEVNTKQSASQNWTHNCTTAHAHYSDRHLTTQPGYSSPVMQNDCTLGQGQRNILSLLAQGCENRHSINTDTVIQDDGDDSKCWNSTRPTSLCRDLLTDEENVKESSLIANEDNAIVSHHVAHQSLQKSLPINRSIVQHVDMSVIREADWKELNAALDLCTKDEFKLKEGDFYTPAHSPQTVPEDNVYSPLHFQRRADSEYKAGFFQTEIAAQDLVCNTINEDVCDVFRAFQAESCAPIVVKNAVMCNDAESCSKVQVNSFWGVTARATHQDWERVADALRPDELDSPIPLKKWTELDSKRSRQGHGNQKELQKASVLRKLTVAYGIGKLLQSSNSAEELCFIDNFAVRELSDAINLGSDAGWEVVGVDMITPPLSLKLISTPIQGKGSSVDENNVFITGRDVMTVLVDACGPTLQAVQGAAHDEMHLCYELGKLLHVVFSEVNEQETTHEAGEKNGSTGQGNGDDLNKDAPMDQPAKKPSRHFSEPSFSQASISAPTANDHAMISCNGQMRDRVRFNFRPLIEYGCPPSISQLVGDLLSCGDGLFCSDNSFKCLKDATNEMQLLFENPNYFLFERVNEWHQGKHLLTFTNDRLFGRCTETSKIVDAYLRVATTRRSEVVMIGGYSGSGKTRLVQHAIERIKLVNNYHIEAPIYVVERKFEAISTQSCLTVILSAFNEICIQIARAKSIEHFNVIQNLTNEFGSLHSLASILPNVLLLLSSDVPTHRSSHQIDSNVNFSSLCFTLQRFMRVVSRSAGPGMLFLDDLQSADQISLGLVHAVLSDVEDFNSMLFVGSYRDNATENDEIIPNFLGLLSKSNVPLTEVYLNGMLESDVNSMIASTLGIVPRLCSSLSHVVHRKTKGNPFFVQEFLRTLVDRDLVTYSLREQRWFWDVDRESKILKCNGDIFITKLINSFLGIGAEPITDNVLHLITLKMKTLSVDDRTALKVASCFGIKVRASVVEVLSGTQKYSNLQSFFDNVVHEGFIDFDGAFYRFAHDKVLESAYDLISPHDKDQYHFDIGMAIYLSCKDRDQDTGNAILFTTIEQINYGVPLLLSSPSQRIDIAQLNYEAGSVSMDCWNFVGALTYMKAARSLLPQDSWTTHYSLSLEINFQLAKAAYPCGAINIAKTALNEIDERGKCLDDKLDAYYLLINILQHDQEDLSLALNTCCKTLKLLGEDVPSDRELTAFRQIIELGRTRVKTYFTSNHKLLNMPRTECKRTLDIMRFYGQLATVAYFLGNRDSSQFLCPYYISRWMSFCLNKKVVCKYTPNAISYCSAMLVYGFNERNCHESYRLGKIALAFLNESENQTELPTTYLGFYGYIGALFEPLQACAEQHRRAYEIGMQVCKTSDAFSHLTFMVPRMIESGTNLKELRKEIELFQQLAETHSHPVLSLSMQWCLDTVTLLDDSKLSFDAVSPHTSDQTYLTDATAIRIVHLIMPALYLGHIERVEFLAKKWDSMDTVQKNRSPMRNISVAFYSGLAHAGMYRRRKHRKYLSSIESSMLVLLKASRLSTWNFQNKVALLAAEKLSIQGKNSEATLNYNVAIEASQASKFIHEEALACELAGKHHERSDRTVKAITLYRQAEKCYRDWGSQKKSFHMTEAIGQLMRVSKTSPLER